ncbi:transglutaminaseTgpA domain-containing protein [Aggregatilineales bacterium SYSU G02658]
MKLLDRIKTRLRLSLQRLRVNLIDRGDWFALLVVFGLLLMPALAFRAADWSLEMRTVVGTILVGCLFGYFLASNRYDEFFALILVLMYGVVAVVVLAGFNEPTHLVDGIYQVMFRVVQWVYDAFTGGINQDDTVFTLLVSLGFWFMAYNATWHVFRINRPWRAVLMPAVALLTNLAIYSGRASLDVYLAGFLLCVMLLLIRSATDAREALWLTSGVRVPRQVRPLLMRTGVAVAVIALLLAYLVPQRDVQERLQNFQEFLRGDLFQEISDIFSRLFTPIEADGPATADYYGTDLLSLGGAIRLGDQPVMFVQAPTDRRWYWRSRVFERYEVGRWSPSATWRVTDATIPIELLLSAEYLGTARVPVVQHFTVGNGGARLVYGAPQPKTFSLTGRIDLARLDEELGDASPVNMSVIRPLRVLETGATYTVTSMVSVATADQLRAAGTDYPEWAINPNTFLGTALSPRVVQLARSIVENARATTPYDQAKAIETWLRLNIRYNEKIAAPPPDVDPVEWFLFVQREGYCTYYATAMATMLRSLGIPARMAAGFSQGTYDPAIGQFVVRERDAHTWVEVFFPGYGWIEFEPTSSQEPVRREGDTDFAPPQEPEAQILPPTVEPTQTATPSPTPTPEATATFTPTPPDPNQQDLPPASPTPTFTPTPTPTPVIVPTVPPPAQPPSPPQTDFLQTLLAALRSALLLFLLLVLLALLLTFLYWYWEWRGMGGLSPVARAYKRLERYLPLAGLKLREQQTPEEKRRAIVQHIPSAERPVTYITRSYIRERFSPARIGGDEHEITATDEAWQDARRSILRRWLERLNPFRRG